MRIVTAVLLGALSFGALAEDLQNLSAEGAALIPPFQQELLGTIKAAMQSGGPTKAVEFCQLLAPEIAAKHSQSPGQLVVHP